MRVSYALKEDPKCFSKLYYAGIPNLKVKDTCFTSCFNRMFTSDKENNQLLNILVHHINSATIILVIYKHVGDSLTIFVYI